MLLDPQTVPTNSDHILAEVPFCSQTERVYYSHGKNKQEDNCLACLLSRTALVFTPNHFVSRDVAGRWPFCRQ